MTIEEILIKHFNWTEKEVQNKAESIQRFSHINDEKVALEKANFCKTEFGLSDDEFNKMLKTCPILFSLAQENIKGKADFYKAEFQLTNEDFKKLLKKMPAMLGLSLENVRETRDFYQTEFNLTTDEFIKLFKELPTSIGLSELYVLKKADFYKTEFGLTDAEFIKMLKKLPAILSYSEENVRQKINFYKKEFDIEKHELAKMLNALPALLGLSEESVKQKKQQILDINMTKEELIHSPSTLAVPTNTLKMRYLILRQIAPREAILKHSGAFMPNQNKTFARFVYLKYEKEHDIKLSQLLTEEKVFQRQFGASSEELMRKYPLTEQALEKLRKNISSQEKLEFSQNEKEYIEKEYTSAR